MNERAKLAKELEQLSYEELLFVNWRSRWKKQARAKQIPPVDQKWRFFGIKSGRGFGKTLSAANWLGEKAWETPNSIWFVIAPTHDDVRFTCFEGPTGLYSVIPEELIAQKNMAIPSMVLKNGTLIRGFAADTPERLRGPQCHGAWCDEIASWRYPKEAWSNLTFGLRLGANPQIFWTGTPKPTPFIRELIRLPGTIMVEGSTYENRANLPDAFFENVVKYEGTSLGRQELYGELLDPEESGYIKRSWWRLWPYDKPLPKFSMVIMSLDTAFTEKTVDKEEMKADPSACSVWGVFAHGKEQHVMLLDAWEDHLGLPALIDRVRKERHFTYGEADKPLLNMPRGMRPGSGRKVDLILIEDKGSGISLRQSLAAENILTTPYNPGRADKLARLHRASPIFAHKRVWAVESERNRGLPRTWADPLITQVCSYVGEGSLEHDDLMDTTTQAMIYVLDSMGLTFTPKPLAEDVARVKPNPKGNPYNQ